MGKQTNYGGKEFVVDRVTELFGSNSSMKAINYIKSAVSQQVVNKSLEDIREEISKATADGVITSQEKKGLKREWASLLSGWNSVNGTFSDDDNLSEYHPYISLKEFIAELSTIMDKVFANMDEDYSEDDVSKITQLFVSSWEYIGKCNKFLIDTESLQGRHKLEIQGERDIVSSLDLKAKLYYFENGSYVDVTDSTTYNDSEFRWYKPSAPDNTITTGRSLTINVGDLEGKSPTQYALIFSHNYFGVIDDNTDSNVEIVAFFEISYGLLVEYSYSDAETLEELKKDKFLSWASSPGDNTLNKLYCWRRETKDLGQPESNRKYEYFRETGKKGDDGISFTVQIISSNGDVFRFPDVDTVLTCLVFRNFDEITSKLDDSRFRWKRNTGNATDDEKWNTSSKAIGHKSVSITSEDCIGRTVFDCEVDLDNLE